MKTDEKMFSFGEIIQSKEFEREAPKNFAFNIRKALHDKKREESQTSQKAISKQKISSLAK